MQQTLFLSEDDQPAGYRLAIPLNRDTAAEISALKQQVGQVVGGFPGQQAIPDITVARFEMMPQYEAALIRHLDTFCFKNLGSASIELSGFHPADEFPAILIVPRQAAYVGGMHRKLTSALKTRAYLRMEALRHPPAIPVAEDLVPEKQRLADAFLAQKIYAGIFYANGLALIRKTGDAQRVVHTFTLL